MEGTAHAALMPALKSSSLMASDGSNTLRSNMGKEDGGEEGEASSSEESIESYDAASHCCEEGKEPKLLELLRKEPCLTNRSIKT